MRQQRVLAQDVPTGPRLGTDEADVTRCSELKTYDTSPTPATSHQLDYLTLIESLQVRVGYVQN